MPTVNESASNGLLDRFPNRIVDVIDFHDCSHGLGLKIFGGISTRGDEHGIFVKQVVPGGLAALSSQLQPGDELLEVNGRSLEGLTNSKAVSLLRTCANQRILTLVVSRDSKAYRGYHKLCNSILSGSVQSLNVSDDAAISSRFSKARTPRMIDTRPSPMSVKHPNGSKKKQERPDPPHFDLDNSSEGQISPIPVLPHTAPRTIFIDYKTGLGMSVCGGTNKAEGPGIYIDSVIKGGDVHRQGILRPGDELISVNGHTLEGLTHERAMKVLTRLKLRQVKNVEICYKPGQGVSPRKQARMENAKVDHSAATPLRKSTSTSSANYASPGIKPYQASDNHKRLGSNSITDTANSFLNAELDANSFPLRTGSLSPAQQISMDKLVVALQYLGYNPTTEQLNALKNKLVIDADNRVRYADFVKASREVFAYKLKSNSRSMLKCDSVEEISRSRAELNKSLNTLADYSNKYRSLTSRKKDLSSSVPDLSLSQRNELKSASAASNNPADELLGHLSRQAPHATPGMHQSGWSLPQYDKDYSTYDPADIIRECAILAAELRKSEKIILQYKNVTEKLLNFAVNVQRSFKAEVSRSRSLERGTPLDRSRTRQSLATVIHGSSKVVEDAEAVLKLDVLPSGWEEAYTEDGARYYINHLTQTTSWDKPT